jgi:sterol desaturase/sphingolipid hydroxylase (fatty acid hydroxylase superfamily)
VRRTVAQVTPNAASARTESRTAFTSNAPAAREPAPGFRRELGLWDTTVVVAGLAFSCADAFVTKRLPFAPTVRYLAVTLPGYLVVFAVLQWLPMPLRFPVPARAPTLLAFTRDLVLCLIVGDVLSYWWHRLEHGSRLVFRRVHYVHHKVTRPLTVWSGFYVHPVESLGVFITFYFISIKLLILIIIHHSLRSIKS